MKAGYPNHPLSLLTLSCIWRGFNPRTLLFFGALHCPLDAGLSKLFYSFDRIFTVFFTVPFCLAFADDGYLLAETFIKAYNKKSA